MKQKSNLKKEVINQFTKKNKENSLKFFKSTIGLNRKCLVVKSEHQVTGQVSFTANQFPRERRCESSSCSLILVDPESWKHGRQEHRLGDGNTGWEIGTQELNSPLSVMCPETDTPSLNSGFQALPGDEEGGVSRAQLHNDFLKKI